MYSGINLKELKALTGKHIYSAAQHGAGIYDFLVFSEKVPPTSDVIIAISKPVQIRRKEKDRNWSGIDISSLFALYNNNYSIQEIYNIIKTNKMFICIFRSENVLFPYSEELTMTEPLSLFEEVYSSIPYYLEDKQSLYVTGIKSLMEKKCHITFIEFPYHQSVVEIERTSKIKYYTDKMKEEIKSLFPSIEEKTITLKSDKQPMYDLSHLNAYGASIAAQELAHILAEKDNTPLYVIIRL
ncbi:hypothetical protein JXQ70_12275 [bacterium]|nr:hypothetical protein [bacterium]